MNRPAFDRRRSRRALATLLGVWAASQIALGWAADVTLWLRDPLFADKRDRMRQRLAARTTVAGRPNSIVVVGSSRTCYAVRGDVLERAVDDPDGPPTVAFNFGIPAAGPVTNLITVRRLVAGGDRPNLLVLEVMPPLFAAGATGPAESPFLLPQRLRDDERRVAIACGFPFDWAGGWLAPWYGVRFPLLGRLASGWLPPHLRFSCGRDSDASGWLRPIRDTVNPEAHRDGVAYARRQYYDPLQRLNFDSPTFGALQQTLNLCAENHVRVALVLMPEGREFRSWYPPRVEAELYSRLADLGRRYDAAVIDARRWFNDDAFSDSHHMLPAAATVFSRRLGRTIMPLLSAGDPSTPRVDRRVQARLLK